MIFFRPQVLTLAAACVVALGTAPASAAITVYTAKLTDEAPPLDSNGIGLAALTLDDASFTMRLQTVFFGLTGNVTVAHIHCCTATPESGTAGVATSTPSFPGFPAGGTQGFYDQTFNMLVPASWNAAFITSNGGTETSAFAALKSGLDSGSAYLNIHSSFAPSGEIRGFLMAPVPEPETYAMMLAGLGMLGWMAKRRQRG